MAQITDEMIDVIIESIHKVLFKFKEMEDRISALEEKIGIVSATDQEPTQAQTAAPGIRPGFKVDPETMLIAAGIRDAIHKMETFFAEKLRLYTFEEILINFEHGQENFPRLWPSESDLIDSVLKYGKPVRIYFSCWPIGTKCDASRFIEKELTFIDGKPQIPNL
jgi:hypothetical protein